MRLALLASAAFCMTAGVAMAQTSMASPAPTGAPNAAMSTPAPQASPGNMAPGSSGMSSDATAPSSNAASSAASEGVNPAQSGGVTTSATAAQTSPHYNGANSVSPPAGKANAGGTGNEATASSQPRIGTHMAYSAGAAVPADADAGQYLKIASKAIKQHNKMVADDALSHAETRMLDRAVPTSAGAQPDGSPAVAAIEHAREALASGDYRTAGQDTRMAMHEHHGMMDSSGMSPLGDAGASSGPAQ